MQPTIRPYRQEDGPAVVGLSLRAWAPVFASLQQIIPAVLFERMHGDDWRHYQQKAVEDVLADDTMHIWVAEVGAAVAGFVAVRVHEDRSMGEIYMIAVDPEHQRRGLGKGLTSTATDWMREDGLPVAMVETGGDPGHAPARRTYEKAEYVLMPVARYFKAL